MISPEFAGNSTAFVRCKLCSVILTTWLSGLDYRICWKFYAVNLFKIPHDSHVFRHMLYALFAVTCEHVVFFSFFYRLRLWDYMTGNFVFTHQNSHSIPKKNKTNSKQCSKWQTKPKKLKFGKEFIITMEIYIYIMFRSIGFHWELIYCNFSLEILTILHLENQVAN